jgi:hypothetical protein
MIDVAAPSVSTAMIRYPAWQAPRLTQHSLNLFRQCVGI